MFTGLLLSAISCQKNDDVDVSNEVTKALSAQNSNIGHKFCRSGSQSLSPEAEAKKKAFSESMPDLSKNNNRSSKSVGGKKKIGVVFKFLLNTSTFNFGTISGMGLRQTAEEEIRILNHEYNGDHLAGNSKLDIQFVLDDVKTHWMPNDYIVEYNADNDREANIKNRGNTDLGFRNGGFVMDSPTTKLNIYVVPQISWKYSSGWSAGLWGQGLVKVKMKDKDVYFGNPFHVIHRVVIIH